MAIVGTHARRRDEEKEMKKKKPQKKGRFKKGVVPIL